MPPPPDPIDRHARGVAALVDALGRVNAVRCLHPFETSPLDSTAARATLLPDLPAGERVRRMRDAEARNP